MLLYKTAAEPTVLCGAAVRPTVNGVDTATAEIRTGAKPAWLREIAVLATNTSNISYGLGRPAARGITPTTQVTFLAQDPDEPTPLSTLATAWTTPPTVPVDFLRRWRNISFLGGGIVLTFGPREFAIPPNSSLVFWNVIANVVPDLSVTIEE